MILKQLFFIFILFLLLQQDIFILAKNVKLTRQDVRIEIQLEKIKNVDFTSKDAIYELVKGILPEKLKKWKKANLKQDAVIFIKHQFNEENLKLKDAFKVRETKILRLGESIKTLEKEVEALEAMDMGKKEILCRRRFKTEIDLLRRERFQLKYWFFEKEKDFDSHLLHKEKKQWSSYLFGTRKFLIVLLGVQPDLTEAGMKVQGKDSLVKKTFFELDKRISSKGAYEFKEEADHELELKTADKFTCRFVELDPKYVRPPCTISITPNSGSDSQEAFDFYVVERNTIQFKIGLAASVLRKLKYTIVDNYITAETEEDNMNHIKENWFFMVDIHPPRDMDAFHPHFYEP